MGAAQAKARAVAERVVLDGRVEPTKYDVEIAVNLGGNFLFTGTCKVSVVLHAAGLSKVTLHQKELHVRSASFAAAGGAAIGVSGISYDYHDATVTLAFKSALPAGPGVLTLDYVGHHNDQMAGFYRSEYKDRSGRMATMVSTQFESLDARRCFPCVDEPGRKAVFKAALVVDDGLTALSNMPVESSTLLDDGKRRRVVFQETPRMSTYLLAFAVADFDYVEARSSHGVHVRVYTPPNSKEMGQFSLDVAVAALDLYDDQFKLPYPLPKLDMVAVPAFAMGAMENWGLVIYREVDLLIDSVRASSQQKQRVAEVVAHELAHQWFGNMVTMQWWSSLWLNEGFASYMQTHCCSKIFPEWSMWEQWVISSQAAALRMDALATSHPIQVPIKRAEEVEQVFDAISYYKGACVVRLIYSFLGKQDFDKGLQAYMLKHKYGNTETEDLWQAWEDASGKPMRRVMASWTDQMGFPLLTVRALAWAADMSAVTLDLEQRWFLSDGSEQPESASKLWSIPLLVTMGDGDALLNLGLMDSRKLRVTVRLPNRRKTWIKLNGGQHVPMRVNYEPVAAELGPLFAEAILGQAMAPADRAGMLLDAYALTKAGFSDPGTLVRLLAAYENETTMPVFSAIEDVLTGLRKIVLMSEARPELRRGFERFGARVIAKACKRLGWDAAPSDGHLTVLLRATLIRLQAQFMQDSTDVQRMARERFEAFSKDPKNNAARLPSDIRTAVLKIVLGASDDAAAYNRCMELIDLADTTQAKKEIFLALGNARSEDLKRRTLDWCTSGAVKKQDFFYPIGSVSASSRAGMELTWQYLQDNWSRIVDMIRTASPSLLEATVSFSCSGFASETKAAEIERFFKDKADDHPVSLITRKVAQIVEVTRANAKFLQLVEKSEAFAKVVASE